MTDVLTDFTTKFRVAELVVERYSYWNWSVRPVQCSLGAGVLSLARPCTAFGAITRDEAAELAHITRDIERRFSQTFRPDKFNYLMLMMVDPQLHFHVVPRYSTARTFREMEWKDERWPGAIVLTESARSVDAAALTAIAGALKC